MRKLLFLGNFIIRCLYSFLPSSDCNFRFAVGRGVHFSEHFCWFSVLVPSPNFVRILSILQILAGDGTFEKWNCDTRKFTELPKNYVVGWK
jgi:hypothetical protein